MDTGDAGKAHQANGSVLDAPSEKSLEVEIVGSSEPSRNPEQRGTLIKESMLSRGLRKGSMCLPDHYLSLEVRLCAILGNRQFIQGCRSLMCGTYV